MFTFENIYMYMYMYIYKEEYFPKLNTYCVIISHFIVYITYIYL